MRIAITELTPVERTAFVTQYARALDSRWPKPILGDTFADEIVGKIDYDFQALGVPSSAVCQTALRAKMLDERAHRFIAGHPDAVVVDLGAGLDTERWSPRLTLVEETSLAHAPEVGLFPPALRVSTRLWGRTKAGARQARILRYRFGN
jgi:hypothetical protein